MRIFENCYQLMSESYRDLWEMGHRAHPDSMQNKIVKDDPNFETVEIINYSYALTGLEQSDFLFLNDKKENVEYCELELEQRLRTGNRSNPGEAWKKRKALWEQFLDEYGQFDYTYNERMQEFKTVDRIISQLQTNPDSRQLILSIWDRSDVKYLGGVKRVPCSIYYQFLYRKGRLHVIYSQRSADAVAHFGNDIYMAFKTMEYIARQAGLNPGFLYHNIGSLHAYRKDWNKLKTNIEELKVG